MAERDAIIEASKMIAPSSRVVGFTGAGVSEESGISTYRDPGGLWDRFPEGASGGIMGILRRHPEVAHELFSGLLEKLREAVPNPGHYALSELEKMGHLKGIITQNGDNLHQEAGSSNVVELHGNGYRWRCLECSTKKVFSRDGLFEMAEKILSKMEQFSIEWIIPQLPPCACGGHMRPDAVGFGEPVQNLDRATEEANKCDVMLIMGTSGVVYPAAMFPLIARERGAKLIEINPRESDLTTHCDLFLPGKTGEILPGIVQEIREMRA